LSVSAFVLCTSYSNSRLMIMSNQVSTQVAKLGKILADPGTIGSYQQTIAVTLTILKETAVLAWYVLCLTLVASDWFWHNSIATGKKARTWLSHLQAEDNSEISNQVGKGVLTAGKSSVGFLISQARSQVGLPAKPEAAPEAAVTEANPIAPAPTAPTTPAE
jgi:hypothetical protein